VVRRRQPGTGQQTVRQFLRDKGMDVQKEWGLRCIQAFGLQIHQQDKGRGPYQEIR